MSMQIFNYFVNTCCEKNISKINCLITLQKTYARFVYPRSKSPTRSTHTTTWGSTDQPPHPSPIRWVFYLPYHPSLFIRAPILRDTSMTPRIRKTCCSRTLTALIVWRLNHALVSVSVVKGLEGGLIHSTKVAFFVVCDGLKERLGLERQASQ